MPKRPAPALVAAMKNRPPPPQDKLDKIRDAVRRARDLRLDKEYLEQQLADRSAAIQAIEGVELPDLLDAAGVPEITIAADGNLPAYEAKCQPYFRANIEASWPPEKQLAGFSYLEEEGAGDLIKTIITVEIPRGSRGLAQKIETGLKKAGVEYSSKLGVPWATLTAWLKERVQVRQSIPDLEKIGGTVGRVVKLKPLKD